VASVTKKQKLDNVDPQAWTCSSVAVIPRIEIGLEQELPMPDDSFMLKYFRFLKRYLSVGPPVYFVVNNTNLK